MYTLVLRKTDGVCALSSYKAFNSCPIYQYSTSRILVPSALLEEYKAATNWSSYFSSKLYALEDYTVDGTVTGELDPDKI